MAEIPQKAGMLVGAKRPPAHRSYGSERNPDLSGMLDQTILVSLEDEARWAMKERLTDKKEVPNYLDFIYVDALEQVKPETVTIIR
jgi:hypothetical protein